MSKQLNAVSTNLVGKTLSQVSGDSRDHIEDSKSDFLRQQTLPHDFHRTNAAEVFQRHELSRRSQPRHLYNSMNPKHLVQKVEEDSSDGQITQDSNDTSDDATGLNSESSFQGFSTSNPKSDASLTTKTSLDILTPSSLASSSINPYSMSSDSHFFIPVHQLNASRLMTLPPNIMVSQTGGINNSNAHMAEEASRKRQLRLLKNKEAAKECRRKKKEYVKCLENRVAVLENQNKTLIEELKSLKELYCQKDVQS